jgi:hypothetical protein
MRTFGHHLLDGRHQAGDGISLGSSMGVDSGGGRS